MCLIAPREAIQTRIRLVEVCENGQSLVRLRYKAGDEKRSSWLFILPSLPVVLVARLTIVAQTWQAARINPAEVLRYKWLLFKPSFYHPASFGILP